MSNTTFTDSLEDFSGGNITIAPAGGTTVITGDLTATSGTIGASDIQTTGASVNVSASAAPSVGDVLVAQNATTAIWSPTGDASGPGSSTDNAIARFDGVTGKLIQNSGTTLDDTGIFSGPTIETGSDNTTLGSSAGGNITSGTSNTLIGISAGNALTTGFDNTFVGHAAGLATTGIRNTFIGREAGRLNTTGGRNTCVGEGAGRGIVGGNDNVMIGRSAGLSNDVSSCVLIGNNAGNNNTISNRLMIDNSNTNTPLIDGDFSANSLQINGVTTIGQTGNTTNQHEINGLLSATATAGARTLPSNPVDFLTVTINGTTRKIPFYAN